MSDYLAPNIDKGLGEISSLGLAHVGDAVFELMARTWLCLNGTSTAKNLHKGTVALVSAKAQAAAVETIMPILSEHEIAIFKRGRNTHTNTAPKGCTLEEYHAATGLETLFGYLYLSGNTIRLNDLFKTIV
jgi:ribonuclease-3 family protein